MAKKTKAKTKSKSKTKPKATSKNLVLTAMQLQKNGEQLLKSAFKVMQDNCQKILASLKPNLKKSQDAMKQVKLNLKAIEQKLKEAQASLTKKKTAASQGKVKSLTAKMKDANAVFVKLQKDSEQLQQQVIAINALKLKEKARELAAKEFDKNYKAPVAAPKAEKAKKAEKVSAPAKTAISTALNVGDKAPEFTTQLGDNRMLSLRDFRGEKVVLYFYPKDDTPGCTQEAKDFTANIEKFTANNAVVLGVSKDSLASHCKFKEKYNFGYTFLADTDGAICDLYGVTKGKGIERSTFLIDEKGVVAQIWRNVKVSGHINAVLAALEGNSDAQENESAQEELLAD